MTIISVISNIAISILASFVFWMLTFVITHTKIIFSTKIEKSLFEKHQDGDPIYRVRIMNIGRRDLIDISYTAKVEIYINGRKRTSYLSLGDEQTVPIFKGKDRKKKKKYSTYMPGIYVSDVARQEFSKAIYDPIIREEAKKDTLTLDDLLNVYGECLTIILFVTGNDRLTGARKTFVSKEYTRKDIIEGRFRLWDGPPAGAYFTKKRAIECISYIDTMDGILKETYVDVIESLNNTNPNAKEEFLRDTGLREPNCKYKKLKIDEIQKKIKTLESFLSGMKESCLDSPELATDISVLENNLLMLYFVKTNYDYLHCQPYERFLLSRKHREYNEKLYGVPQIDVFLAVLQELKPEMVPKNSEVAEIYHPDQAVFNKFSEIICEYLKGLLSYIPNDRDSFSPQEACKIANDILDRELHATQFGWKAIVDPDSAGASVCQQQRLVKIPGKRSKGEYTYHDLRGTIAHEIGVHVNRALPANRTGSFSLSVGLPHYEVFEEGLATAVEQAVNHHYSHPGYRHYLSLGFAEYDHLDFRGVFEKQLEVFGDDEKTRKQMFDSVQRAFRGTGELVNSKDLAYFNGSELVWQYISEHINDPNLLKNLFEMGKIDITRQDHREIAERILKDKDTNTSHMTNWDKSSKRCRIFQKYWLKGPLQ